MLLRAVVFAFAVLLLTVSFAQPPEAPSEGPRLEKAPTGN